MFKGRSVPQNPYWRSCKWWGEKLVLAMSSLCQNGVYHSKWRSACQRLAWKLLPLCLSKNVDQQFQNVAYLPSQQAWRNWGIVLMHCWAVGWNRLKAWIPNWSSWDSQKYDCKFMQILQVAFYKRAREENCEFAAELIKEGLSQSRLEVSTYFVCMLTNESELPFDNWRATLGESSTVCDQGEFVYPWGLFYKTLSGPLYRILDRKFLLLNFTVLWKAGRRAVCNLAFRNEWHMACKTSYHFCTTGLIPYKALNKLEVSLGKEQWGYILAHSTGAASQDLVSLLLWLSTPSSFVGALLQMGFKGQLHRDLSPDNMIFNPSKSVFIYSTIPLAN